VVASPGIDRLPPGVGDPHAGNPDRPLVGPHGLGRRGREPVAHQDGQHGAVPEQHCLGSDRPSADPS